MSQLLKPGILLLAEPSLTDPNFEASVVLLCAHGADGALGLVLNRPTELKVHEILEQPGPLRDLELPLSWGGPVGLDRLHVLHAGPASSHTFPVCEGVTFGGEIDELAALHQAQRPVRFFLGYAGWDAGQLEQELAQATWRVLAAQAQDVFDPEVEVLWQRLLAAADRRYAWLRHANVDPRAN